MDDAHEGVFQEGWREGFGADADHLKTTADIDVARLPGIPSARLIRANSLTMPPTQRRTTS
jgi:hypothetical protein